MSGYDRGDPKHPDWADLQLQAGDEQRKRDREEERPNPYVEAWKDEWRKLAAERGPCQERPGCIGPVGHEGGCFIVLG